MAKIGARFEVLEGGAGEGVNLRRPGDVFTITRAFSSLVEVERESDGYKEFWSLDMVAGISPDFLRLLPDKVLEGATSNTALLPLNEAAPKEVPKPGDVIRDVALLRDGMRLCWEHRRHDPWTQGNGFVAPNADSVRKFGLVFLGWEVPGPRTGDRYVLKLGCGVALEDGSNVLFEEWRAGDVVKVANKYMAHWVVKNERTNGLATWDVEDESWFRPIGREVAVDSDRRQPFKEHHHCAVAQRNLHAAGVSCYTCESLNAQDQKHADDEAARVRHFAKKMAKPRVDHEPAPTGLGGSSCGGLRWSPR